MAGAISSAVEHCIDIAGVTGSIPVLPTILSNKIYNLWGQQRKRSLQTPPVSAPRPWPAPKGDQLILLDQRLV